MQGQNRTSKKCLAKFCGLPAKNHSPKGFFNAFPFESHPSCLCKQSKKDTRLSVFFNCWRRGWDSNPRGFWPNGFQDFLRNPTLPQNNRKYQTIENAENPVKSRAFGVLSFPKPKTSSSARISASKTVSKDFLEKVLDKSSPICPMASHV